MVQGKLWVNSEMKDSDNSELKDDSISTKENNEANQVALEF